MRKDFPFAWALLAALLAVLAGIDQALGGTPAFRDNLYYFLPQFGACRSAISGGELPLWNPFMGCGHPLMATMQCAVASPLSLPFMVLPYPEALIIFWVTIMLAASGGMFALARQAGLGPAGACVAAVLYSCAGPMRSLTEWPPIISGMALLPLALLAFDSLLRNARGGVVSAALFGSLQAFAGQPRQAAIAGLACLLWALAFRPDKREYRAVAKRIAGALALSLAIAAVQLLPSMELFHYSERRMHGVPPSTVSESFLHIGDLVTLVLARFWGDEHQAFGPGRLLVPRLYIGWIGLWLAVSGAVYTKGRAHFFSILAIITGFALALGEPVYGLLFRSATESHTLRYMGHLVIPSFIGIGLLAGSAIDGFSPRIKNRLFLPVLMSAIITAGLLASPLAGAMLASSGWPENAGSALADNRANSIFGAFLLFAGWMVIMRLRGKPGFRMVIPTLISADLILAFHGYTFKVDREFFSPPDLLQEPGIRDGRLFAPASAEQIYPDSSPISMRERYQGRWNIASPNIPQIFGIRNAHGYEPFRLESQRELFGAWESGSAPAGEAIKAAGCRWAVMPPGHKSGNGWIKRRILAGDWCLWEVPNPRALAEIIPAPAVKSSWNLLNRVAVTGSALISNRGWNAMAGNVSAPAGSVLLIRNSWYPGWKAFVNGKRAPIIRAGGVFMAVPVPAGRSAARLDYSPPSFRIGLLASCIGLTIALLTGLYSMFFTLSGQRTGP